MYGVPFYGALGGQGGPRVCAYFMTPRGCAKGAACSFSHMAPTNNPYANVGAAAGGIDIYTAVAAQQQQHQQHHGITSGGSGGRACAFYFSPRGCAKGAECSFSHIMPAVTSSPSALHMAQMMAANGGTSVGTSFAHMELPTHAQLSGGGGGAVAAAPSLTTTGGTHPLAKTRMCAYYQSQRGCAKGALCDFSHDAHTLALAAMATSDATSKPKKGQCAFWSTKGCVKGDACDFAHIGAPGGNSAANVSTAGLAGALAAAAAIQAITGVNPSPLSPSSPAAAALALSMTSPSTSTSSRVSPPPSTASSSSSSRAPTPSDLAAAVATASAAAAALTAALSSSAGAAAQSPQSQSSVTSPRKPCAYYSTSRGCAKGDACDFTHSTNGNMNGGKPVVSPPSSSSISSTNSLTSGAGTGTGKRALPRSPRLDAMVSPLDSKDESSTSSMVTIIGDDGQPVLVKRCLYYGSARGCAKGDKCDFAHVGTIAVGDTPSSPSSDHQMVDGKRVCTFFGSPRGCVKGDACDFAHLSSDGTLATVTSPGKARLVGRPCAFFLQPRGCAKGAACDFSHDIRLLAAAYANAVPELWQGSGNGDDNELDMDTFPSPHGNRNGNTASQSTVAAAMAAVAAAASAFASLPAGYEPAPDSDDDDDYAEDLARIPCRDHWSGYRCLRGERCRFMHDRDVPTITTLSSSSIISMPEGAKKRRTESGGTTGGPPTSIAVSFEDKSDDHVKALLYKYMKTAMAVSPKMIEFLQNSPDIYRHVRRVLADFAFDTLHSSDLFSPAPSPIPSPAPSPTNASSSSLSLIGISSSSMTNMSSSSADVAAVMTQQAAVTGVGVELIHSDVDGGLQVDTSLSVGGISSSSMPPTPSPCPSPPPSTAPLASRPSVSEFLTPLRQSHLSRIADLYMTQLMAGQCNLSDAKQSLSFLSSSLAATPDPGPASSLTPSQSVGIGGVGAPLSTPSSSSTLSNGNGNGSSNGSTSGAPAGHVDVFAFDNPYMRNFR